MRYGPRRGACTQFFEQGRVKLPKGMSLKNDVLSNPEGCCGVSRHARRRSVSKLIGFGAGASCPIECHTPTFVASLSSLFAFLLSDDAF